MRLGLFGGTFDPIHLGHLILAESCREACGLDRVLFVVAGAPPHKPGDRTAVADRLEMARIAVAGHPAFEVSEIEARRPGPHYSVETLEAVHAERPERRPLLPHRRRQPGRPPPVEESRPDRAAGDPRRGQPPGDRPDDPGQWPDLGPDARPMQKVSIPPIGIASHDLRRRRAEGRSIRYQVPRGVEAYIDAHGLYRRAEAG